MYELIKSLRPHFFSLREIDENVSLDMKIPVKWKFEDMMEIDEKIPFVIKIQDKKSENSLISLISPSTPDGYEFVLTYAKKVILVNKEEEEKERLFKEKINELKELFLNSPLDKLKDISFKDGEIGLSHSTSTGEAELGDEKGSGADGKG